MFITYPEAIDLMSASNFWGIILSLTLFLLGLDSAFAFIEAVSTVIYDGMSASKDPTPRPVITAFLCILGFALSLLFCTNWGIILFDIIDHYLSNYLLFFVGLLQCFGVGWCLDWEQTAAMGEKYQYASRVLFWGYWVSLLILGIVGVVAELAWYAMPIFVLSQLVIVMPWSYYVTESNFDDWYMNVCMCGVRRIGYSMSKLARVKDGDSYPMLWWEPGFVLYFALCIKYIIPFALWFVLLFSIQKDFYEPYGDYARGWQLAGVACFVVGLIIFFFFTCFCLEEVKLSDETK